MPSSRRALALLWCVTLLPLACSPPPPHAPAPHPQPRPLVSPDAHAHGHAIAIKRAGVALAPVAGDLAHLPLDTHTRTLGLLLDGDLAQPLRYRAQAHDLTWGDWAEVELTWSEGALHVGRVALPRGVIAIALRGGDALHDITALPVTQPVDPHATLTRALPLASPADAALELRTARGALSELVIPREQWGARQPDRICNEVVAPYRLSIHHTAEPDSDGPDPAARMRQMQAFHIDTRMWCDFGYHFVVSQSGLIYEGRRGPDRPAAHVGELNDGNIGVSLIGNFEVSAPTQPQLDALVALMRRLRQLYPGIPWDRDAIRGHQQWPGQSTACPGQNLLSQLDALVARTATDTDPTGELDGLTFQARWVGEPLTDRHTQGTSRGVLDALPGDTFQAELTLTNRTDLALEGATLGIQLEGASIVPEAYTIQSDAPALNATQWQTIEASDGPLALDEGLSLDLGALEPGESRRVVIDVTARGARLDVPHASTLRAWVQDIPEVYEGQLAWDATPQLNRLGRTLQSAQRVDALSQDAWFWQSADPADVEGWRSVSPAHASALERAPNAQPGVTLAVSGRDPILISPPWTRIDASQARHLSLDLAMDHGPHLVAIAWAREGESFSQQRTVRFMARGEGGANRYLLDLGAHPEWRGEIASLRVDPVEVDPDDPDDALPQGIVTLSALQARADAPDAPLTPLLPADAQPPVAPPDDAAPLEVHSGCAFAPSTPIAPTRGLLALASLALVGLARRRAR